MVEVAKVTAKEVQMLDDLGILDFYLGDNPFITKEPLPHQFQTILRCILPPKNSNIVDMLVGGNRGSGKTTLGEMLCEMYLMDKEHRTAVLMKTLVQTATTGSIYNNLKRQLRNFKNIKIHSSSPIYIENMDNGSTIEFYSCANVDEFKARFQGKSYNLIIIDESSFIDKSILEGVYGSLRKPRSVKAPLKLIHLSNPSARESSTSYLREKYILGNDCMFLPSSFKENHYLDTNYEQTLQNLDYIDKQYQLYGNWFYTIQAGDLINEGEFNHYLSSINEHTPAQIILSLDVAGSGDDLSVVTVWWRTKENKFFVLAQHATKHLNCDGLVVNAVRKYNPSLCIVEGGIQSDYLVKQIEEKLNNYTLRCNVVKETVHTDKYSRARVLVANMLNGNVLINKDLRTLNNLKGELLSITPKFKGKSPDYLDSVTVGVQYFTKKMFTKGGGIKILNINDGTSIGFNLPEQPDPEDYDFSRESDCINFHNTSISRHRRCKEYALDLWREGKLKL